MRIGSIIIFHLSKLWKAKFLIMFDVILLVRPQRKFDIDHSWEWKVKRVLIGGSGSWRLSVHHRRSGNPSLVTVFVYMFSSLIFHFSNLHFIHALFYFPGRYIHRNCFDIQDSPFPCGRYGKVREKGEGTSIFRFPRCPIFPVLWSGRDANREPLWLDPGALTTRSRCLAVWCSTQQIVFLSSRWHCLNS